MNIRYLLVKKYSFSFIYSLNIRQAKIYRFKSYQNLNFVILNCNVMSFRDKHKHIEDFYSKLY